MKTKSNTSTGKKKDDKSQEKINQEREKARNRMQKIRMHEAQQKKLRVEQQTQFSNIVKNLERIQGITPDMVKTVPPRLPEGLEHNLFGLLEFHFGFSIRQDVDLWNDMYSLNDSPADAEQRDYVHNSMFEQDILGRFRNSKSFKKYFYGTDMAETLIKGTMSYFRVSKKGVATFRPAKLKQQMIEFLNINVKSINGSSEDYQALWK